MGWRAIYFFGAGAPSLFKIFQVDADSPPDQPLMVSANWTSQGLVDVPPFGKKGFVVFTKGGSGGIYRRATDVTSPNVFPQGRDKAGHPYRYVLLQ